MDLPFYCQQTTPSGLPCHVRYDREHVQNPNTESLSSFVCSCYSLCVNGKLNHKTLKLNSIPTIYLNQIINLSIRIHRPNNKRTDEPNILSSTRLNVAYWHHIKIFINRTQVPRHLFIFYLYIKRVQFAIFACHYEYMQF